MYIYFITCQMAGCTFQRILHSISIINEGRTNYFKAKYISCFDF